MQPQEFLQSLQFSKINDIIETQTALGKPKENDKNRSHPFHAREPTRKKKRKIAIWVSKGLKALRRVEGQSPSPGAGAEPLPAGGPLAQKE